MTDAAHLTQRPGANDPTIHARRGRHDRALCGAPPGSPFTTERSSVTCLGCLAEIERRLAARARPGIVSE